MQLPDRIEALLFDIDGTLVNTDDKMAYRFARIFAPFFPGRAARWGRWCAMKMERPGNWVITLLDILHIDQPVVAMTDWWREFRGGYKPESRPLIPGVRELFDVLPPEYRIGIVTTRSPRYIETLAEQYAALFARVEVICGTADTRRLKPHPAPLELAAQRLGIPVVNCAMIGDTPVDMVAARRAGAFAIGVLCGFGERDELVAAGADIIIGSTAHLLTLFPPRAVV